MSRFPSTSASWAAMGPFDGDDVFNAYTPHYAYNAAQLANSMDVYQAQHQHHLLHHQTVSRTTESKPRLSKDEVDVLEAEFQRNHKPSSNTKKKLAESMNVENARINVSLLNHHPCWSCANPPPELVPEPPCQGKEGEEHSRVRGQAEARDGAEGIPARRPQPARPR